MQQLSSNDENLNQVALSLSHIAEKQKRAYSMSQV